MLHRRRKVKCDEQRPRCSHCERLNLECKWRPLHAVAFSKQRNDVNGERPVGDSQPIASPSTDRSSAASGLRTLQAMDEVFDYASFMWDPSSSLWQQESPDMTTSIALDANIIVSFSKFRLFTLKIALPFIAFIQVYITYDVR